MRMIIRNCPAIYGIDDGFLCSDRENDESEKYCYDCTNCVMKQIVELCKSACIDCSSIKRITYTQCKDLNNCKTAKILKLLGIQEVK